MADSVSGELVIVPDSEAMATNFNNVYMWDNAMAFAAAYSDGVNSDYRLPTKTEMYEFFSNPIIANIIHVSEVYFWTVEEVDASNAYRFYDVEMTSTSTLKSDVSGGLAIPVRKVNFYGLPLIESEFGGGLVFDVVAETRTVSIAAKWADVVSQFVDIPYVGWDDAMGLLPDEICSEEFETLPTRAQALKIFGNSYLVSLAGLPLDGDYWTSEEVDLTYAHAYVVETGIIEELDKSVLNYVLPVRSEVVPES